MIYHDAGVTIYVVSKAMHCHSFFLRFQIYFYEIRTLNSSYNIHLLIIKKKPQGFLEPIHHQEMKHCNISVYSYIFTPLMSYLSQRYSEF